MNTFGTAWAIARRRLTAGRGISLALLVGIVVASALLASTSIYARAMADLGLTYSVRDRFGIPPTTQIITPDQGLPLGTPASRELQQAIDRRMRQRLGWFTGGYARFLRLSPLTLERPGQSMPRDSQSPAVWVQSLDGYENHVRTTAGALPQAEADTPTPDFQVAVSSASAGGLAVGDHIVLADSFDDCERHPPRENQPPDPPCTPHATAMRSVPATVAAVVEPLDESDPFWADGVSTYFSGKPLYEGGKAGVAAFIPSATMTGPFAAVFGDHWATQRWYAYADLSKLTRENYKRAGAEIAALRDDASAAQLFSSSTLPPALEEFNRQLSYDQAPLLILILQIAGIALFYVAIVAAMAVERQQPEIALLKSRGAGSGQILAIYLLEGLLLAAPATLVGPLIGAAFTRFLGLTPAFHSVTGGRSIPTTVDSTSYLLAALGGVLSIAAIMLPAALATRFSGISLRRQLGRPRPSVIQRYYLDAGLLGLCGILLWELDTRGTVFKPGTAGGLSSDPLLLLAPAMLTLSLALLFLRLYPILLRAAGRLFAAGSGISVVLGLWQMTRNPSQYTRLALLLMMSIAVGGFAASYSDTTNRSFRERAQYHAGVDLRGGGPAGTAFGGPTQTDAAFSAVPGVAEASSVLRTDAELGTQGSVRDPVHLLALDPIAASSMLWYRTALSHDSLKTLMADLGQPTRQIGRPIAGEPAAFSLWVNPSTTRENVTAWARFRQASGRYVMYELGKLDFAGWRQLTARLESAGTRPLFPVSLVSIVLTQPPNGVSFKSEPVYFDDFSVLQADGQQQPVEDFEGISNWTAAPQVSSDQDNVKVTGEVRHGGSQALRFQYRQGVSGEVRGFYVADPNVPLPAIISRDFARRTGIGTGSVYNLLLNNHLVPIKALAIADLFPTLDPAEGPYVVLNRAHIAEWIDRMSDSNIDDTNEIWLTAAAGADRGLLTRTLGNSPYRLTRIIDLGTELKLNGSDPLIAAGGSGILFVSFIAALVLVAGAFLVALFSSLRRRRIEFAVMAALGLGRGRVFAMLAFEYTLVTVVGATAGIWLGLGISRVMLSFLNVTPTGDKLVPPFVLATNWGIIVAALCGLALVVAFSIGFAARSYTAGTVGGVLRDTE